MRKVITGLVAFAALLFSAFAFAQVSTTNGILTLSMSNTGGSTGQWTVRTGASHPQPNRDVLYPIGTSWITLRDATAQEYWANAGSSPPTTGMESGFTSHSMQAAPATAVVTSIPGGFRATYTLPNWTVVQDVVIVGTTLTDTSVRQSVTVTNTSGIARQYGVRYFWDWYIAGNDASLFRTRNPNGTFTSTFQGFNNPSFQAFEEVDNITTPTFSIYGTVTGGSLSPAPTTPDRFGYVSWSNFDSAPWDLAISGAGSDSATVHYWGFTTPLTLAAGASRTFVEYISTVQSAVGLPSGDTAATIPTLSDAMLVMLAAILAFAAYRTMRGRGTLR